jgi:ATP synthase protein I
MRPILYLQVVIISLLVAGFFAFQNSAAALAAGYGGAISLTNTLLLIWRMNRAERIGPESANATLSRLMLSALERFATVAFMFALGMGALRLTPLPMLVSFGVTTLALISLAKSGRD